MGREFILTFRDNEKRSWYPVGKLHYDGKHYYFYYLKGAKRVADLPVIFEINQTMDDIIASDELSPFFSNRIMQNGRPNYKQYLGWLNTGDKISPLDELSKTYGVRATDSFQIFEVPQKQNGKYITYFFCHGMQYRSPSVSERVKTMSPENHLYIMYDIQNEHDKDAIALRTSDDPAEIVGYCPRFFAKDLKEIAEKVEVRVTVEKVNLDAPMQLRLLCKIEANWPEGFKPFQGEDFEPINPNIASIIAGL